jgi:hypothetical protein
MGRFSNLLIFPSILQLPRNWRLKDEKSKINIGGNSVATKFFVQTSVDGGETWENYGMGYDTDGEAVAKKKEIDCHINGQVEVRVVEKEVFLYTCPDCNGTIRSDNIYCCHCGYELKLTDEEKEVRKLKKEIIDMIEEATKS